jgi:membrane protein
LLGGARELALLAKDAGARWVEDACFRYAASLAYAAFFSIFPLLLLCVIGLGYFLGDGEEVRHRVVASLAVAKSPEVHKLLDETLQSLQKEARGTSRGIGTALGVLTLLIGASGVFSELQSALDAIWRVKTPPPSYVWANVLLSMRLKALAFATVVIAAAVVLASVVVSAVLGAMRAGAAKEGIATGPTGAMAWPILESAVSAALLAVLIAAVYRMVPQAKVAWRDVAGAAIATSLVFTALKESLTWYLERFASYTAYGGVGAVLGMLTWIYIVATVLLWGAEVSRLVAERYGSMSHGSAR